MVMVLPIHFGVVFDCKGGGGKKKNRSRELFSGAGIPNRAIGQTFHHARGIRLQRKRGQEKTV